MTDDEVIPHYLFGVWREQVERLENRLIDAVRFAPEPISGESPEQFTERMWAIQQQAKMRLAFARVALETAKSNLIKETGPDE